MAANLPSRPAGSEATADPATAAGGGAETGTTLTRVAVAAAGGAGAAAGTEEVAAAAEHTEPATQSAVHSYDNITEGALGLTQGFVIIFHVNSTSWWAILLLLSSPSK